jgi:cell division inhibitor SepF
VREDDRRPVARDLTVEDEARPTIHLKRNSLHRTYTLARTFPITGENPDSMALRDTWHRTLVYFGLAEEEDPRYESLPPEPEPEAELEDRYRDRPNVRRLQRRRRDEFDDIFADEPRSGGRETRVLRPVGGNGRSTGAAGEIQVHLVIPKSFNDAQQIADQFKDSIPVILNLQSTDTDLSKRLIDFASGLTYALDGGMQRIADKVFLLTPRNVEVSAEERARLIEKGFFNQS